jgi:beta-fructofuranosidase
LQYHFMGEYGWINDPNGFIQYRGRYHLFYQHYPYGPVWGPMHWGHAVSEDLVTWSYLPVALAPDRAYDQDGCFSGSAIEKDGRLYLLYTGHVLTGSGPDEYRQTQNVACSDEGFVFAKLPVNPVIDIAQIPPNASKQDFRDPKVFQSGAHYYLVIGSNDCRRDGQVLLYRSPDLLNWEFVNVLAKGEGRLGSNWECPDLFRLGGRDVLLVSAQHVGGDALHNLHSAVALTGKADLAKGVFETDDFQALDDGFDFYAPQTTLDDKGRRLVVAWMDMWESAEPTRTWGHHWAGAMTLPREMILKDGRLCFKPIREIEKYRRNPSAWHDVGLDGEIELETGGDSYELQVTFEAGTAVEFGLKLRANETEETVLAYDRAQKMFRLNRDRSGRGPKGERRSAADLADNRLELRIFVDRCSVEVFIGEGVKVMTARIYPGRRATRVKLFSKGPCTVRSLRKWDIVTRTIGQGEERR